MTPAQARVVHALKERGLRGEHHGSGPTDRTARLGGCKFSLLSAFTNRSDR